MRRLQRRLKRYWPVWVLLLGLTVLLIGVFLKQQKEAEYNLEQQKNDFGVVVNNESGQELLHVVVHMTWPDDSVETTCHLDNVERDDKPPRKIYAPPGSRISISVTFADGAVTAGEREVAPGTQGILQINVHKNHEVKLE
jgi:hypothetical protein